MIHISRIPFVVIGIASAFSATDAYSDGARVRSRIAFPERFTDVVLAEDGRKILLFGSVPGIRAVNLDASENDGELAKTVRGVVTDAFFNSSGDGYLAVERDVGNPGITKIVRLSLEDGQPSGGVSLNIAAGPVTKGAADEVVLSDRFSSRILVQPTACLTPERQGTCSSNAIGAVQLAEHGPLGGIAYGGRWLNNLLVSPGKTGALDVFNYQTGLPTFRIPNQFYSPKGDSESQEATRIGIDIAASEGISTIYLSSFMPSLGQRGEYTDVMVVDIDRKLNDWFPVIQLQSVVTPDDASKPHKDIVGGEAATDLWFSEVEGQRSRVALSSDQKVVILLDGRKALAHLRREEGSVFVSVGRYHVGESIVVNFSLSADGRTLAVLLPHEVVVLEIDPLYDPFIGSNERTLVAAIERKLGRLGLFMRVVDGEFDTYLQDAVRSYQGLNGLPKQSILLRDGFNTQAVADIFRDEPEALAHLPGLAALDALKHSFSIYFKSEYEPWLEKFTAREFLTSSEPRCVNDLADPGTWENVASLATVLDELRNRYGVPVKLMSTYQSESYAECVATPASLRQAHKTFSAAVIAAEGPGSIERIVGIAQTMQVEGYPVEAIHQSASTISISVTPASGKPKSFLRETPVIVLSSFARSPQGCHEAKAMLSAISEGMIGYPEAGGKLMILEPQEASGTTTIALTIVADKEMDSNALSAKLIVVLNGLNRKRNVADVAVSNGSAWTRSDRCFASREIGRKM